MARDSTRRRWRCAAGAPARPVTTGTPGPGSRRLRERVGGRMAAKNGRQPDRRRGGGGGRPRPATRGLAGTRVSPPPDGGRSGRAARRSGSRSTPAESPPRLRLSRQMGGAAANFREDVSGRGVRRWGRTARPPWHGGHGRRRRRRGTGAARGRPGRTARPVTTNVGACRPSETAGGRCDARSLRRRKNRTQYKVECGAIDHYM